MVALKFDAVDLIFSAGGAVAAMMILHFVHTQVLSYDFNLTRTRARGVKIREGGGISGTCLHAQAHKYSRIQVYAHMYPTEACVENPAHGFCKVVQAMRS